MRDFYINCVFALLFASQFPKITFTVTPPDILASTATTLDGLFKYFDSWTGGGTFEGSWRTELTGHGGNDSNLSIDYKTRKTRSVNSLSYGNLKSPPAHHVNYLDQYDDWEGVKYELTDYNPYKHPSDYASPRGFDKLIEEGVIGSKCNSRYHVCHAPIYSLKHSKRRVHIIDYKSGPQILVSKRLTQHQAYQRPSNYDSPRENRGTAGGQLYQLADISPIVNPVSYGSGQPSWQQSPQRIQAFYNATTIGPITTTSKPNFDRVDAFYNMAQRRVTPAPKPLYYHEEYDFEHERENLRRKEDGYEQPPVISTGMYSFAHAGLFHVIQTQSLTNRDALAKVESARGLKIPYQRVISQIYGLRDTANSQYPVNANHFKLLAHINKIPTYIGNIKPTAQGQSLSNPFYASPNSNANSPDSNARHTIFDFHKWSHFETPQVDEGLTAPRTIAAIDNTNSNPKLFLVLVTSTVPSVVHLGQQARSTSSSSPNQQRETYIELYHLVHDEINLPPTYNNSATNNNSNLNQMLPSASLSLAAPASDSYDGRSSFRGVGQIDLFKRKYLPTWSGPPHERLIDNFIIFTLQPLSSNEISSSGVTINSTNYIVGTNRQPTPATSIPPWTANVPNSNANDLDSQQPDGPNVYAVLTGSKRFTPPPPSTDIGVEDALVQIPKCTVAIHRWIHKIQDFSPVVREHDLRDVPLPLNQVNRHHKFQQRVVKLEMFAVPGSHGHSVNTVAPHTFILVVQQLRALRKVNTDDLTAENEENTDHESKGHHSIWHSVSIYQLRNNQLHFYQYLDVPHKPTEIVNVVTRPIEKESVIPVIRTTILIKDQRDQINVFSWDGAKFSLNHVKPNSPGGSDGHRHYEAITDMATLLPDPLGGGNPFNKLAQAAQEERAHNKYYGEALLISLDQETRNYLEPDSAPKDLTSSFTLQFRSLERSENYDNAYKPPSSRYAYNSNEGYEKIRLHYPSNLPTYPTNSYIFPSSGYAPRGYPPYGKEIVSSNDLKFRNVVVHHNKVYVILENQVPNYELVEALSASQPGYSSNTKHPISKVIPYPDYSLPNKLYTDGNQKNIVGPSSLCYSQSRFNLLGLPSDCLNTNAFTVLAFPLEDKASLDPLAVENLKFASLLEDMERKLNELEKELERAEIAFADIYYTATPPDKTYGYALTTKGYGNNDKKIGTPRELKLGNKKFLGNLRINGDIKTTARTFYHEPEQQTQGEYKPPRTYNANDKRHTIDINGSLVFIPPGYDSHSHLTVNDGLNYITKTDGQPPAIPGYRLNNFDSTLINRASRVSVEGPISLQRLQSNQKHIVSSSDLYGDTVVFGPGTTLYINQSGLLKVGGFLNAVTEKSAVLPGAGKKAAVAIATINDIVLRDIEKNLIIPLAHNQTVIVDTPVVFEKSLVVQGDIATDNVNGIDLSTQAITRNTKRPINAPIIILKDLKVSPNLQLDHGINGIEISQFLDLNQASKENRTLVFDRLHINGNLFVESGVLNGFDLIALLNNLVLVDEPNQQIIGTKSFENAAGSHEPTIFNAPITIHERINGKPAGEVFERAIIIDNPHNRDIVIDVNELAFQGPVTIRGNLTVGKLLNKFRFNDYLVRRGPQIFMVPLVFHRDVTLKRELILKDKAELKGFDYPATGLNKYFVNDGTSTITVDAKKIFRGPVTFNENVYLSAVRGPESASVLRSPSFYASNYDPYAPFQSKYGQLLIDGVSVDQLKNVLQVESSPLNSPFYESTSPQVLEWDSDIEFDRKVTFTGSVNTAGTLNGIDLALHFNTALNKSDLLTADGGSTGDKKVISFTGSKFIYQDRERLKDILDGRRLPTGHGQVVLDNPIKLAGPQVTVNGVRLGRDLWLKSGGTSYAPDTTPLEGSSISYGDASDQHINVDNSEPRVLNLNFLGPVIFDRHTPIVIEDRLNEVNWRRFLSHRISLSKPQTIQGNATVIFNGNVRILGDVTANSPINGDIEPHTSFLYVDDQDDVTSYETLAIRGDKILNLEHNTPGAPDYGPRYDGPYPASYEDGRQRHRKFVVNQKLLVIGDLNITSPLNPHHPVPSRHHGKPDTYINGRLNLNDCFERRFTLTSDQVYPISPGQSLKFETVKMLDHLVLRNLNGREYDRFTRHLLLRSTNQVFETAQTDSNGPENGYVPTLTFKEPVVIEGDFIDTSGYIDGEPFDEIMSQSINLASPSPLILKGEHGAKLVFGSDLNFSNGINLPYSSSAASDYADFRPTAYLNGEYAFDPSEATIISKGGHIDSLVKLSDAQSLNETIYGNKIFESGFTLTGGQIRVGKINGIPFPEGFLKSRPYAVDDGEDMYAQQPHRYFQPIGYNDQPIILIFAKPVLIKGNLYLKNNAAHKPYLPTPDPPAINGRAYYDVFGHRGASHKREKQSPYNLADPVYEDAAYKIFERPEIIFRGNVKVKKALFIDDRYELDGVRVQHFLDHAVLTRPHTDPNSPSHTPIEVRGKKIFRLPPAQHHYVGADAKNKHHNRSIRFERPVTVNKHVNGRNLVEFTESLVPCTVLSPSLPIVIHAPVEIEGDLVITPSVKDIRVTDGGLNISKIGFYSHSPHPHKGSHDNKVQLYDLNNVLYEQLVYLDEPVTFERPVIFESDFAMLPDWKSSISPIIRILGTFNGATLNADHFLASERYEPHRHFPAGIGPQPESLPYIIHRPLQFERLTVVNGFFAGTEPKNYESPQRHNSYYQGEEKRPKEVLINEVSLVTLSRVSIRRSQVHDLARYLLAPHGDAGNATGGETKIIAFKGPVLFASNLHVDGNVNEIPNIQHKVVHIKPLPEHHENQVQIITARKCFKSHFEVLGLTRRIILAPNKTVYGIHLEDLIRSAIPIRKRSIPRHENMEQESPSPNHHKGEEYDKEAESGQNEDLEHHVIIDVRTLQFDQNVRFEQELVLANGGKINSVDIEEFHKAIDEYNSMARIDLEHSAQKLDGQCELRSVMEEITHEAVQYLSHFTQINEIETSTTQASNGRQECVIDYTVLTGLSNKPPLAIKTLLAPSNAGSHPDGYDSNKVPALEGAGSTSFLGSSEPQVLMAHAYATNEYCPSLEDEHRKNRDEISVVIYTTEDLTATPATTHHKKFKKGGAYKFKLKPNTHDRHHQNGERHYKTDLTYGLTPAYKFNGPWYEVEFDGELQPYEETNETYQRGQARYLVLAGCGPLRIYRFAQAYPSYINTSMQSDSHDSQLQENYEVIKHATSDFKDLIKYPASTKENPQQYSLTPVRYKESRDSHLLANIDSLVTIKLYHGIKNHTLLTIPSEGADDNTDKILAAHYRLPTPAYGGDLRSVHSSNNVVEEVNDREKRHSGIYEGDGVNVDTDESGYDSDYAVPEMPKPTRVTSNVLITLQESPRERRRSISFYQIRGEFAKVKHLGDVVPRQLHEHNHGDQQGSKGDLNRNANSYYPANKHERANKARNDITGFRVFSVLDSWDPSLTADYNVCFGSARSLRLIAWSAVRSTVLSPKAFLYTVDLNGLDSSKHKAGYHSDDATFNNPELATLDQLFLSHCIRDVEVISYKTDIKYARQPKGRFTAQEIQNVRIALASERKIVDKGSRAQTEPVIDIEIYQYINYGQYSKGNDYDASSYAGNAGVSSFTLVQTIEEEKVINLASFTVGILPDIYLVVARSDDFVHIYHYKGILGFQMELVTRSAGVRKIQPFFIDEAIYLSVYNGNKQEENNYSKILKGVMVGHSSTPSGSVCNLQD